MLGLYTVYPAHAQLGNGSAAKGGAASCADGGQFAMGNTEDSFIHSWTRAITEEHLIVAVLGVAERGDRDGGPFQRRQYVSNAAATA